MDAAVRPAPASMSVVRRVSGVVFIGCLPPVRRVVRPARVFAPLVTIPQSRCECLAGGGERGSGRAGERAKRDVGSYHSVLSERSEEKRMIIGIHHVGYVVPDLDEAAKVFTETLGMKIDKRVDAPGMGLEIIAFRLGKGETGIELMKPVTDSGPFAEFLRANPKGALHHVAYATTKPLADAVADIQSCGLKLAATTANGPIDAPPGWRIVNIDPSNTQGLLTQFGER
jgi:methylmalonyl-CoA epimerase